MQALQSHPGALFIVAAPSGAGKSSLVEALLQHDAKLRLSVSYTTRAPRPGEEDGKHYHFTTLADFMARREQKEFLESANVHGNYYGTSRLLVEQSLKAGVDVLLEIDWQGAQQVKSQFSSAIGIFILPPSLQALALRLTKRGQDSDAVIARRLSAASAEISHAPEFEYVIINEDFDVALAELASIIKASRLRFNQQFARHHAQFTQLGVTTD